MRQVIFTLIMLISTSALGDLNEPEYPSVDITWFLYDEIEIPPKTIPEPMLESEPMLELIPEPDPEPKQPPILYNGPEEDAPLYTAESHPDEFCIALNIYYESRADNLAGRYAVADVVLNRTMDNRFPNTVCDVVYEAVMIESWKTQKDKTLPDSKRIYYPKKHRCQFSWYCDGKPDVPKQTSAWRDAQKVAWNIFQNGRFRGITEGATHYHATYVAPWWAEEYEVIGRVGEHIFYYWEPQTNQAASN